MTTTAVEFYAPVDHSGADVPPALRPWSAQWPAYAPVDITPPELRPGTLDAGAAWIVDHATDPADLDDVDERQADAVVPFAVDDDGRPLNPTGRTGRAGRNLGQWGENAAADPIVIAGRGAARRVLLIRRGDVAQWAIPGGMVDPGETAPAALVRELAEETGVDLAGMTPTILDRTYVDDWRATDHAWVCSTVALYELDDAPDATAGDDATDARWWPAADVDTITAALAAAGAELYPAHRALLATALGHGLLAADVDQTGAAEPELKLSPSPWPASRADVVEIAILLDLGRELAERIADFAHAETRAETDAAATTWRQRLEQQGYEVEPEIRAGLLAPSEPQQRTPTATRAYVADVAARLDIDTALAGEVADLILARVEHNLTGLDRWWD